MLSVGVPLLVSGCANQSIGSSEGQGTTTDIGSPVKRDAGGLMPEAMTEREKELRTSYFTKDSWNSDYEHHLYDSLIGAMELYRYPEVGAKLNKVEAKANESIRAYIEELTEDTYKTNPEVLEGAGGLASEMWDAKTERGVSQTLVSTATHVGPSVSGRITVDGVDAWTDKIGLLPNMREYFETLESDGPKETLRIFKWAEKEHMKDIDRYGEENKYSSVVAEMKAFQDHVWVDTIEKLYADQID